MPIVLALSRPNLRLPPISTEERKAHLSPQPPGEIQRLMSVITRAGSFPGKAPLCTPTHDLDPQSHSRISHTSIHLLTPINSLHVSIPSNLALLYKHKPPLIRSILTPINLALNLYSRSLSPSTPQSPSSSACRKERPSPEGRR